MVDKYFMSGCKLYWHLDRVSDWLKGKRIAPLYIDMGITQTCNIACAYCYYAVPENRTRNIIPTDALIRFLKDAAEIDVKAIGFLGDGEPMIHLGVYDAVIAGAEAGLDMAIATNGLILKTDRLKDFLTALTWLRFTIGAATPEKYGTVMGTSQENYYKVIKNIEKCVKMKRQYDLRVTIGLQMVLISECANQIVPFAKLGRDIGVDYAVIKQCSQSAGVMHNLVIEDYEKFEPLFQEAESYSNSSYDVIIKRRKMQNTARRYDRCFGCEFLPQITGGGDVYVCGNFFGKNSFWVGNIMDQSFKEIVFGDRYVEVMKKVRSEVDVHKECGINCRQNEINEFLWMLKNPPEHVNFI
jgi:MoaA/NifB/PqqE/SkfB family radical SAM enzyme